MTGVLLLCLADGKVAVTGPTGGTVLAIGLLSGRADVAGEVQATKSPATRPSNLMRLTDWKTAREPNLLRKRLPRCNAGDLSSEAYLAAVQSSERSVTAENGPTRPLTVQKLGRALARLVFRRRVVGLSQPSRYRIG